MNWRKAREQAGLTQKEVAERVGLTNAAYSLIERGLQNPQPLTRENLNRVLAGKPAITHDELRAECKRQHEAGTSIKELAERYYASESTISRWIGAKNKHSESISDKERNEIIALRKQGYAFREIAEQLGHTYDTVYYHCQRANRPTKRAGRKRTNIPERTVTEWCDLRRYGWTLADIASVYGNPVAQISRLTMERDESLRSERHNQPVSDEEIEEMQRLRDEGCTLDEIAERSGYSTFTISQYTVPSVPIYTVYDKHDTVIASGTLTQVAEQLGMSRQAIASTLHRQRRGRKTRRKFVEVGRERVYA